MRAPTIRVDRRSPLSAAEQLKARVRVAIRAGELRPGLRLPRVRALARAVGVNTNTVAAAFRDFAREGLIVARGRAGTRVAPGPFLASAGERQMLAAVDRLVQSARGLGCSHGEILRLVAGRWDGPLAVDPQRSVYELLLASDHDQG
jgi:DNA-binding transcriptional regulator YhcF (GntR family)